MPNPTTLTFEFPDGLTPSCYSDLHAVLEGRMTSRAESLDNRLQRCSAVLSTVAVKLGIPSARVVQLLFEDDCCGDNYAALGNVLLEAALTKRAQKSG